MIVVFTMKKNNIIRIIHLERQIIVNKKNITKINWDKVDKVPESQYNYTDSPEVTPDMFKKMRIMFPDEKKNINIRLKNSTINFFKTHSKHYQSTINAILDAYVETQLKKS